MIGMDFGTTNSSAAVYDGKTVELLPLDPWSRSPHICRSSIYITNAREYHLGNTALNLYFNQNVGRPTRYKKIRVGEIMQVFAELPTFYRDVYVFEDEFSPGRLFLSIKTALRDQYYYGTVFQNSWYSPSDLVAVFLLGVKLQMEKHLDAPVKEIALGRPVYFSTDPTEDKIAQSRLLDAAFKAGFEKIYLEYEPVAAALHYERSLKDKEMVLVFDFGGGTLDFTVIEVGDPTQRQILATGGIPVAGDVFDQRLFRATIPKHLGEGDYFVSGGAKYPIPAHIFDLLTTPQEILSLNTPENLTMLRGIHNGALHKNKTYALLRIVTSNYALLMFDLVERAKCELSSDTETRLRFEADDFTIEETITRKRFERAITQEYTAVKEGLQEVITRSGLKTKDIDRVIRTGGSSQIPLFTRLLHHMFGYDKVEQIDVFSSVTSGLAIRGYEIDCGMADSPPYTPESHPTPEEMTSQRSKDQGVAPIDLDFVQQRMEVNIDFQDGGTDLPDQVLVLVRDGDVQAIPVHGLDEDRIIQTIVKHTIDKTLETDNGGLTGSYRGGLTALEDRILLATNSFKLILPQAKSLLMAEELNSESVSEFLPLEKDEHITAIGQWRTKGAQEDYICIVTKYGQARCFDAGLLADYIEKRPYFELERRYDSFPACLSWMAADDMLITGTNNGRVGRASRKEMSNLVYNIIKARKGEEVTAAQPFRQGESLLAVSEKGHGIAFDPMTIPSQGPAASKGRTLRRNFHIVDFVTLGDITVRHPRYLTTKGRAIALQLPDDLHTDEPIRPLKVLQLDNGERLLFRLSYKSESTTLQVK
ncbi:MAG: Hsp70 family protein [Anaerolineales bacterium]|jgi:hypothetical chaperone protein